MLKIEIKNNQRLFKPGEKICGKVRWRFERQPKRATVQLFWFTKNYKEETLDEETAIQLNLEEPYAEDSRSFEFIAPSYPLSFTGKLFSIHWAIVLKVCEESIQEEVCISPTNAPLTTTFDPNDVKVIE